MTTAATAVDRALMRAVTHGVVYNDAPFGARTTYRVGGPARWLAEVESTADVAALSAVVAEHDLDVIVFGLGSNMLVADRGFDGLVLRLGSSFTSVEVLGGSRARVGGAAPLPTTARSLGAAGLAGFAWAVGVPGTLGGAVRMNAGGHGSDMAASVRSARIADLRAGQVGDVTGTDLRFGYRRSAVSSDQVVLSADLVVELHDPKIAAEEMREIVRWRREHQPGGQNAGSVFTNPDDESAGALIDRSGLKGLRMGGAVVSPKHANFIQASPTASSADVIAVMGQVIDRVHRDHGVVLVPETRLVGFTADDLVGLADTGGQTPPQLPRTSETRGTQW